MHRRVLALLSASLIAPLAATPVCAQWAPGGVPLCNGCNGYFAQIVADGTGGAFVSWREFSAVTDDDVYLGRVTSAGTIPPGWPPSGLGLAALPDAQLPSWISPDGFGGAFVTWNDFNVPGVDVFVQRVQRDGSFAPGWPLTGVEIVAPSGQYAPIPVAADGVGGAYVAWRDSRDYAAIHDDDAYAIHLAANGSVVTGWPTTGLNLALVPSIAQAIVPDDSGGAVFFSGTPQGALGLRINADGTLAAGWPAGGIQITPGQGFTGAVPDHAGGFYVWSSTDPPLDGFDYQLYLRRYTFGGTISPGWPQGGVLVCNAAGKRAARSISEDGAGGVLLAWYDYRPNYNTSGNYIFALRVLPNGALAPGWTTDGTLVSDPTTQAEVSYPVIVSDGQGGGYLTWYGGDPSWVQHLSAKGHVAGGWPTYGLRLAPSSGQFSPSIVADGQGGAIVAWDDSRHGIFVQSFGTDGPVPVELSLVRAEVKEDRVVLDWYSAGTAITTATVSRRTENSAWVALEIIAADGTGHLRYEDRDVTAGARYGYRLSYTEQGVERFTPETWVDIPAPRLALDGLRPNPAVGALTVSFSLPTADAASLEILDVTGRRIAQREVGSLGAGPHVLRLGETGALSPGIYWLRLQQGGRALLARGAVVR